MGNESLEKEQIAGKPCEADLSGCLIQGTLRDIYKAPSDKTQTGSAAQFDRSDQALVAARDTLKHSLSGKVGGEEFDRLTNAVEDRARDVGLTPAQVEKTYEQINRIATATGEKPMTSENRTMLVKQFMQHMGEAAPPLSGKADTCEWGVLAFRMMQKEPDVLGKMVADMATTGHFKLPDGRKIKIDAQSLEPDANAKHADFTHRDYFGQIASVGLDNVKWATETEDPDGNKVKLGTLHFQQKPEFSGADIGERVFGKENGKKVVFGDEKNGGVGGLAYLDDPQKVEALLTGKKHPDYAVYLTGKGTDGRNHVDSPAELAEMLKVMQTNGDWPATMNVFADKSPVREIYLQRNPSAAKAPDSFHGLAVVNVKDVNGKPVATVYNPWGYMSEVPVATLFDALSAPPKPEDQKEK